MLVANEQLISFVSPETADAVIQYLGELLVANNCMHADGIAALKFFPQLKEKLLPWKMCRMLPFPNVLPETAWQFNRKGMFSPLRSAAQSFLCHPVAMPL